MSECEHSSRLSAYHDGELPAAGRAELERHLGECPRCAAELEAIRKLSRLLGTALPEEMPAALPARLHRAIDRLPSPKSIIRLAEALAAVAAGILLTCILALSWQSPTSASPDIPPAWEIEAAVGPADEASADSSEQSLVSWIVLDLSRKDEHD